MSCRENSNRVAARAAPKNGIHGAGNKSGFTAQVSFFTINSQEKAKRGRAAKKARQAGLPAGRKKAGQTTPVRSPKQPGGQPPTQRQLTIAKTFTADELSALSVQLRLNTAAAGRHIRRLDSRASRDIGHDDPRPADWAYSDLHHFQFLTEQLTRARRDTGRIDLSALNKDEAAELWEFLRFEADRVMRNIDHLRIPAGPIGGPTAGYLVDRHKIEARFYTHLADQIEAVFPVEQIEAALWPAGGFH